MIHRALLVTVLILLAVVTQASASIAHGPLANGRYLMNSWQTDQGLPQNSVVSMTQSHDGYLWLATFNGLVRFDGVRFTIFNAHNTPALESSRVVRVWEDKSGCLWIGTESGGIVRREKGVFQRVASFDAKPAQLNAICDGVVPGEVWLALVDGRLFRYSAGKVDEVKLAWNNENLAALVPLLGSNGKVLVWTDKGAVAQTNGNFAPLTLAGLSFPNSGDVFAPSRRGGTWRTFNGKTVRIELDQIVESYDSSEWLKASVATLFEDREGSLWIGTLGGGVAKLSASGRHEAIREDMLRHAQVRSFLEDHEGNIWIGTDGAGLYRVRVGAFSVIDKSSGLGADIALAVADTEDGLWIGTNGGGLTHVNDDGAGTLDANGLPIVHVWTLLQDREKTLWVGTWGAGVFRKPAHGQFEAVPMLSILGSVVLASHQDPTGALWFGGLNGLARLKHGKVKLFTRTDGLSHDDVRAISDDGEGGLWIGSNGGGLNHLKDGKFTAIRRAQGLADESVWALYRDNSNALWIGTFGGGLSVLRDGKLKTFTTQDGLPSAVICSITEDSSGNLWMSSYSGVFRVNKSQLLAHVPGTKNGLEFFVFTKSDGLPSRECTGGFQPAVCKTRDGRMIFPTVKGVAIVDPEHLPFNPREPAVAVEEAEVDGAIVALEPTTAVFKVPANRAQVEFRYTGLSFSAPEKVRFRYKMEGLDPDWVDAGARRSAYYSHLPPGDYRFHVIAANNDGVWNNVGASLAVHVVPAIWQTWWFLAACVLMAGGGFAGFIRYVEVGKLNRRMELLEQQHAVERERARIAKDIHDDLGASLTQITLLSELARTDLTRPAQAEQHIRKISGTARELTRAMDEIVWAVNPQNDTLEDLLTYTVKFAQEHLGLARIRCRIDVPSNLPPMPLSAETRHNLFLAIKEAINNVAKHSRATEVWLRLRTADDRFVFEIEDNGCGISAAALAGRTEELTTPGSHNGLRNMERRLREIGGTFEIAPGLAGGTLVRMRVASDSSKSANL